MASLSPLLGHLHGTRELLLSLVESVDDADCRRQLRPDLSPLGWYLGRAVFSGLRLMLPE